MRALPNPLAVLRRRLPSATTAVLVALALVIQGWITGPIALRMAIAASLDPAAVLCLDAGGHGVADAGTAPDDGAPAKARHAHAACDLCLGSAPPMLPAVAMALPILLGAPSPAVALASEAPTPRHDHSPYASRAPPLTA